jgi:hypothetical protein
MGIINLQTNLRTLRYNNDTRGGGTSGLPYVRYSLDQDFTKEENSILIDSARFSSDYPVRGGLYSVRSAAEDAIRIRKFLTDFPKGSNFTQKQVDLQRSNPFIETGINSGRLNTRVYNLNSNLLFSVLNAGTGTYYPRPGANPFTLQNDENKYISIVGKKETLENRLVNLYDTKILNSTGSVDLTSLGISSNDNELLNYNGGPDSTYGIGETTHFKSTDYFGVPINTNSTDKPQYFNIGQKINTSVLGASNFLNFILSGEELDIAKGIYEVSGSVIDEVTSIEREQNTFKGFFNTMSYENIVRRSQHIVGVTPTDFRKEVESPEFIFSRDYNRSDVNIESRVGIGSPGARPSTNRKDINDIYENGQDKVNIIPLIHKDYNSPPEEEKGARDLIKFNIETLDNNDENKTYRTHFRAFLTNFGDNLSGDWSANKYAGRGDNMFAYQGFNRDITFSFVIAAQSKQEMKPLWQKLNYLASTIYPDYSPSEGFMRGNIHRVTIGEYLYRTPGILKSLNLSVADDYPWEIKMDQPENGYDSDMMELPQIIKASVIFTPILSTLPRTITINDTNVPSLITNNVGKNNFINNYEINQ